MGVNPGKIDSYTLHAPATLYNSWVPNRSGAVTYWKDAEDIVHFYFELKSGVTSANTTICVMPAGFIPDNEYLFNGYCEGGTPNDALFHVTNSPAGEVKLLRTIAGNTLLVMKGDYRATS